MYLQPVGRASLWFSPCRVAYRRGGRTPSCPTLNCGHELDSTLNHLRSNRRFRNRTRGWVLGAVGWRLAFQSASGPREELSSSGVFLVPVMRSFPV